MAGEKVHLDEGIQDDIVHHPDHIVAVGIVLEHSLPAKGEATKTPLSVGEDIEPLPCLRSIETVPVEGYLVAGAGSSELEEQSLHIVVVESGLRG